MATFPHLGTRNITLCRRKNCFRPKPVVVGDGLSSPLIFFYCSLLHNKLPPDRILFIVCTRVRLCAKRLPPVHSRLNKLAANNIIPLAAPPSPTTCLALVSLLFLTVVLLIILISPIR
ncbi:hypothetical protein K504DRAFT_135537 [Pleomassaria siparia CBS 279.74]|uniref:Uncharacterized protein n=1 Tax=Pleomassaria siparia CBS 279.74 TaxID=1314801 RepID=A0A6G1KL42_9PLEO|nr:hypothetical protein K504DRAFT_135537 [Pleomassaria siparia CBS 279.74]